MGLKVPRGGHYNAAFGKVIADTPYADMHAVARSNLLFCMDHLPGIIEMRAGWRPSQRAKITHPDTMATRLRAFLKPPPREPERHNWSPMAALKTKLDRAERDKLDLAEQLAAAQRGQTRESAEPVTKPAGPDNAALVKELAQAKARIAELEGAVRAGGQDEIDRLKRENAALEAAEKRSRFSERGYIVPKAEFNHWRFCAHPDRIVGLIDIVRDAAAGKPVKFDEQDYEKLIARFGTAARSLNEFKDTLVNEPAEEARKQSDARRAVWRWKREEEERKKEAAKRERAAAKRAAKKAAQPAPDTKTP